LLNREGNVRVFFSPARAVRAARAPLCCFSERSSRCAREAASSSFFSFLPLPPLQKISPFFVFSSPRSQDCRQQAALSCRLTLSQIHASALFLSPPLSNVVVRPPFFFPPSSSPTRPRFCISSSVFEKYDSVLFLCFFEHGRLSPTSLPSLLSTPQERAVGSPAHHWPSQFIKTLFPSPPPRGKDIPDITPSFPFPSYQQDLFKGVGGRKKPPSFLPMSTEADPFLRRPHLSKFFEGITLLFLPTSSEGVYFFPFFPKAYKVIPC